MRLQELFNNTSTGWRWTFRGSEEAEAAFDISDVEYKFYAYTHSRQPGEWEVEFKAVEGVDPRQRFGLTGTGNSAKVMSTVVDILKDFLHEYEDKILSLTFTAKEHSRKDLYARMVRRLLPTWDFKQDRNEFLLTAPKPAVNLAETTEEDRALISLSSAMYDKITSYKGTDLDSIDIGKIGDMYDTSITALNGVSLAIQGGDTFLRRLHEIPEKDILLDKHRESSAVAFWDEDADTVVFNKDYLDNTRIRTTITHELRHALDSVKSGKFPNDANRYFTPKKKEHRKLYYNAAGEVDSSDARNLIPSLAQPAEINARFSEVLHKLTDFVKLRYSDGPRGNKPHLLKAQLTRDFNSLLNHYHIADLFPEKTQSKDYKRLVSRAYDFMQKEINHIESQPGATKRATGNW